MRLVHLPAMRRKSLETLSHTALSVAHLLAHPVDAAIVFNAANAPFLPLLRAAGIPVATHVDGLEWKRASGRARSARYYRRAESLAVRWSDALIADAQGIADYYRRRVRRATELIAYGAPILLDAGRDRLAELGLEPRGYHLVVARFEPENHVDVIVEGYRRSARAPAARRRRARRRTPTSTPRRVHARWPTTGSASSAACGTRSCSTSSTPTRAPTCTGTRSAAPTRRCCGPSGAGAATIAYDVDFNREVLGDTGRFFTDADSLEPRSRTPRLGRTRLSIAAALPRSRRTRLPIG